MGIKCIKSDVETLSRFLLKRDKVDGEVEGVEERGEDFVAILHFWDMDGRETNKIVRGRHF